MNKLSPAFVVIIGAAFFLPLNPTAGAEMSRETKTKLNAAVGNWKAITPEILLKPENADLLEQLKILAKDVRYTSARVPLIKLNDTEVISSCLAELRAERSNARSSAISQLGFSGNSKIIPMLSNDLNRDESPEIVFRGDQGIVPVSMRAASVIKAIILESSDFSGEVKEWAKSLPRVSGGLRDGIRDWWAVNKEAIEREDYRSVVAGKQLPPRLIARAIENRPAPPLAASTPSSEVALVQTKPVASSVPTTPVAQTPVTPAGRQTPVWWWFASAFALLVITWLVVRRRA